MKLRKCNNIFENAKFGDKFKTRNGRTALYIDKNFDRKTYLITSHNLFIEGDEITTLYTNDGKIYGHTYTEFEDGVIEQLDDDIVSALNM